MGTKSNESFQLKWHSFGAHLHAAMTTLYQNDSFTDVILCTHDGGQVKAHRLLLSLCSSYFQNLFKNYTKICMSFPVMIILPLEIDSKTLELLIQYIYCGETTVSNDALQTVLKAGDILKIRGLYRPRFKDPPPLLIKKPLIPTVNETPQPNVQIRQIPGMKKIFLTGENFNLLQSKDDEHPEEEKAVKESQQKIHLTLQKADKVNVENFIKQKATSDLKIPESNEIKRGSVILLNKPKEIKTQNETKVQSESKSLTETNSITEPIIELLTKSRASGNIQMNENESSLNNFSDTENYDDDKYLVIKEEPIEWEQLEDVELGEESDLELKIKAESIFQNDDDDDSYQNDSKNDDYTPLSCELCSATFKAPSDWVKHIDSHTELHQPAKRQRRGVPQDESWEKLPPLLCDLCQKPFPTPAEWVRHIQQAHTETELALSNNFNPPKKPIRISPTGVNLKICSICDKRFPSHASMIIHARTHTGERPFLCTLCNKGFNVKSNLLRHLRTLHDKTISSTDMNLEETSNSAQ